MQKRLECVFIVEESGNVYFLAQAVGLFDEKSMLL